MAQIYNADLIGVQEDVTDEFLLLNHYQIPLTTVLGFSEDVASTTHVWYEDTMYAKDDVINNGAVVLPADTSITVTDGTKFLVGHILKFEDEDELLEVTVVSTNTLTVVRTFGGSTAAGTVADGTNIQIQFLKGEEGADARTARYKARVEKSNFTQIFDDSIKISGTAEAVVQHNVDSEYIKERQKKIAGLADNLENAFVNGVKSSSGQTKTMAGIRSLLVTNTVNGAAADISEALLNAAVLEVYRSGGFKNGGDYIFMMGPVQKRMLSAINNDKLIVPHQDRQRGVTVDAIVTDFGTFPVVINDHLRPSEIMFLDRQRIKLKALRTRSWFHTFMGKVGDKTVGTIVGEYTIEFHQEQAHALIYNLDVA